MVKDSVLSLPRSWVAPAIVATWAAGGVALAYYDRPLSDALWVILYAVWAAYWVGAAVFIGVLVYLIWRRRAARHAGWTVGAMLLLVPALWFGFRPLAAAGDAAQFRDRFARLAPQYRAIASALAASETVSRDGEMQGIHFVVDAGPPVRVAFLQPGGILDNWEGVVYDPTGAVRAARGWTFAGGRQDFTAPSAVRRLFGGDLVACEPVRDAFYRCWFT